jgi:anti-sigma B factor antagonist
MVTLLRHGSMATPGGVDETVRQSNYREALVPVTFRFPSALAPSAQRVSLIGPFNNWTPNAHPLARTEHGWWIVTINLPPGARVVYCFDVDGTIWLDPNDHGRVLNGWGSEHSVRNVEPISEPPSPRRSSKVYVPIQGGAQVFEYGTEETPEAVILRPRGEMDFASVSVFRDALTAAIVRGRSIVMDMSGIESIDGNGFHALIDHANACKQRGDLLILVAPRGGVQKIFEMTHLDDAIPVVASVEVALDLLRARLLSPSGMATNADNG